MRILVAPQELKGTLTALEAAQSIAKGLVCSLPTVEIDLAPLADGGPGTVEAFLSGAGGERRRSVVRDPLGRNVQAEWAMLPDGSAVIEMAAAAGLWRLLPSERDPLRTSTEGVGDLIRTALDADCRQILIGLGGSATNDGGTGAARALGVRFLDDREQNLPAGGLALSRLSSIDLSGLEPRIASARLFVVTDVDSPLLGPRGASRVFGPQKGASAEAVALLEQSLERLMAVTRKTLGVDVGALPGAGAAGGLGFGLAAFLGARLESGFAAVAHVLGLSERIARADWVITGEGRFDAQTSLGKGPGQLGAMARAAGKPAVMMAGEITAEAHGLFERVVAVSPEKPKSKLEAIERMTRAAEELGRWIVSPGSAAR